MKSRTSVWRGLAFTALGALTFAACDEKEPTDVITPDPVVVSVTPTSLSLATGQTGNAIAVVTNATTNQTINWRSANPAVATVSPATGGQVTITAVGVGNTVITAISAQDTTARAAVAVTVTASPVAITMSPPEAGITVGQTVQMVAQVTGTTNTAVTYRTSAATVASVSTTGLVTGVAAGTAVITAVATADTTKRATSVITVSAQSPVQITLTPVTAAVTVGQTVQFVATVTGATNTGVIWRSSATTVATVSTTGLATGVAPGTAVISAISAADTTRRQTATLTVNPRPPEASVSIASVTTAAGAPVNPAAVAGLINVLVNLSAVPENQVQRAAIIIDGVEICTQVFTPVLGTTQSVATINCPVNTAALNAQGQPVFPNGPHILRAVAFRTNGDTAATATFPTLTFANPNVSTATVTWTQSTIGTDGRLWNRGDATVVVSTAVFTPNTTLATVPVILDINCDFVPDATLNATAANNFTVVFTEGTAAAPGPLFDVTNQAVCFRLGAVNSTAGLPVPVNAGAGFGGGFLHLVDNEEPVANPTLATLANPAAQTIPFVDTNWLSGAFVFLFESAANPGTVPAAVVVGVSDDSDPANNFPEFPVAWPGGVTACFTGNCSGLAASPVTFHAVPAAQDPGAAATQAQLAAAAAANPAISSASQLNDSPNNFSYRLVIAVRDAVGNVSYYVSQLFGVDKTAPTLTIVQANGAPVNNHINPQGHPVGVGGPSGGRVTTGVPPTYTFVFQDMGPGAILGSDFPALTPTTGPIQVRLTRFYGLGAAKCWNVNTKAIIQPGDQLVTGVFAAASGADSLQAAGSCAWVTLVNTVQFDMTGLPEGVWEVQIRAVDRAGNPSTVQTRVHVLDNTAPALNLLPLSPTVQGSDSVGFRSQATHLCFNALAGTACTGAGLPSPVAAGGTQIFAATSSIPLALRTVIAGISTTTRTVNSNFTLTTTPPVWRGIQDLVGGTIYPMTGAGFNADDLARNYTEVFGSFSPATPNAGAYDAIASDATAGTNPVGALASFTVALSGTTISNGVTRQVASADWGIAIGSGVPTSRTVTITAVGNTGTGYRRPFASINVYRVDQFGQVFFVCTAAAPTTTIVGGQVQYDYSCTMTASGVVADLNAEVFAVGLDFDNDAIRSAMALIQIQGSYQPAN